MSENKLQNTAVVANEANDELEIDLLELFYRLIENVKSIIAAALVGALLMGVYSFVLATPTYEATSKIYVMSSSDSAINLSDLQIGSYLTSDYQEVFDTWEVREMVARNLGLPYDYDDLGDMMTITNPSNTRVLYITITSTNPQEAADIANEMAKVAGEYIAETMETDTPSELSRALVPTKPITPRKKLNVAIGFILGAMVMAAVVIVRFILDDKIRNAEDIRRCADIPTLAIVPSNSTSNRASLSKQPSRKGAESRGRR